MTMRSPKPLRTEPQTLWQRLQRHAQVWDDARWPLWLALMAPVAFLGSNALTLLVSDPATHPLGSQIIQQALAGTMALLLPLLARDVRRASAADLAAPPPWRGVMWTLGSWAVVFAVVWIAEALSPTLKAASDQVIRSFGFGQHATHDMAAAVSICLMAPWYEELLFRRLLFRSLLGGLQRWLPAWLALAIGIAVSSWVFADIHGGSGQDEQRGMLFIMGAMFCIAYVATRSIWVPVLIHGLNNACSLWQGLSLTPASATTNWAVNIIIWGTPLWLMLARMLTQALMQRIPQKSAH